MLCVDVGFINHMFRYSQCSMTGVSKAVVCAILSGMVHIKLTKFY